jgi:aryl-alcohol dehydrogenase-like predicted oxidoreductase
MPMSSVYGSANDSDSIATIHRALDIGINLLDTADVYGNGHNEELVGRAIQGRRDEVVLATKFGNVRNAQAVPSRINGRPEYVREACEASLRRLGVDTIDLYQQHRVDPDTPIEETVGAMSELVAEARSGSSGCLRRSRPTSTGLPPYIRSPACRANTRCSSAVSRRRCCPLASSSESASYRSRRWSAACWQPA